MAVGAGTALNKASGRSAWNGSYARMPAEIRRFLPTLEGDRVWPSSFWLRRKPRPV